MADYVSDSDDEAYSLTSVHIRQEDIADAIVSFQSDAKAQQDAFDYLRDRGLIPRASAVESDAKRDSGDAENSNLLKAYLKEQMNNQGSRRSLRKRNFSSTHPYLADQAHWLGLMDVDTLNEIYSETQDVESIVKLLNSMYMKKRKRYPREERYKPKSFYSFLGRNMPPQETQDEAFQSSQLSSNSQGQQDNPEPQKSDLSDVSYSESEDELIVAHRNRRPNFAILDEEYEAEENDEECLQVEISASHNKSYSTKERILYHSKPMRPEGAGSNTSTTRRGLAMKKTRRRAHRANNRGVISLDNFIDDNDYQDSIEARSSLPFTHDDEYFGKSVETESFLPLIQDDEQSLNVIDLTRDYDWPTDTQTSSDEESVDAGVRNYVSRRKSRSPNHIHPPRSHEPFAVFEDRPRTITYDRVETDQRSLPTNRPKKRRNLGRRSNQARIGPPRALREKNHFFTNMNRRRKRSPKLKRISNDHARTPSKDTQINTTSAGRQKNLTFQSDKSAAVGMKFLQNVYQRTPNQSTTIFEATKLLPQKERNHGQFVRNYASNESIGFSMAPESGLQSIALIDQNIRKLGTLDTEYHRFIDKDSFKVVLFGQSFSFSIFDLDGSNRSFAKVVQLIRMRITEKNGLSDCSAELGELNEAIKVLIEWSLVLQKPSIRHIHLVSDAIADIFALAAISLSHIQIASQFLLLTYIMLKICQRANEVEWQPSRRIFEKQCSLLFKACFQNIDFFQLVSSGENIVSLYGPIQIASTILHGGSDLWWSCITDAVLECKDESFIDGNVLYGLSWLAMKFPRPTNWSAFLAYYRTFCKRDSSSEGSHLFLDVLLFVGSKLSWPFDERLVLELYSSIGIRKFANYENESNSGFLLGKINTRSDIPDSTFFERYMLFLYSYVSALPFGSNKKRLITKLLTSSRFHYTSGSAHRAMFLNRLNFIILLCQLSDIPLESQLLDLISQVDDCNDYKIYKMVTQGITSLTEMSSNRPELYPYFSLAHMVELVTKKYSIMPEIFKLWPSLNSSLHTALKAVSINESLYEFLVRMARIYECSLPDDITLDMTEFLLHAYDSFPDINSKENFIEEVSRNSLQHLNYHMGRYPLTNPNLEHRTETIVEKLINLWVRSALYKGNQSWDVLILQKFPYFGNQESREKFSLYFYATLLESHSATGSYDTIIVPVMKQLAQFSVSKYFVGLLNQLIKNKHEFFDLKGQCGLELVTGLQFSNFRTVITSSILHNIASSESTSAMVKQRYSETFLESLNHDFGLFFLSQKYVTFCKKMTLLIQTVFQNSSSSQTLNSLCVRLGIAQSKSTSNWTNLSFVQRLKIVNSELITALSNSSDSALILDSYVATASMDIVYYLSGIYCQELLHHNLDKWPIFCHLLHYTWEKLSQFKINGSEPNFLKFVKVVGITQVLCRQANYSKELEDSVKKASILSVKILDHSRRMFDGFREQETILDVIYEVSQNGNSSTELDFMNSSLSNVCLYDIQTPDATMAPISTDNLSIDEDTRLPLSINPEHEAPTEQACLNCDL
ncbi:hypothetical protein JA9_003613 [Meyerozyma sp. JA9]|nr:hypothetical protein JA9_003613 [Meyerozyma sp. JA9]